MGTGGPTYMDLGVVCPVGLFAFKIHMENLRSAPTTWGWSAPSNKQICPCFELIILSHHCGTYFLLATGVQSLLVSLHFMQLLFITYLFSFLFNGKTYLFTT